MLNDVPEEHLKKGDVGTIVEEISGPLGVKGFVQEFFDANGHTVSVNMVNAGLLGPLPEHSILLVREFKAA